MFERLFFIAALAFGTSAVAQVPFWQGDSAFAPVLESPVLPLEQRITTVAVQADGKVVVSGYVERLNGTTRPNPTVPFRLNADGSEDTAFEPGSGTLPPAGTTAVVAMDPLGRIYARRTDDSIGRFSAAGVDDGQFNARVNLLAGSQFVPFADGSVALALVDTNFPQLRFQRLRADGTIDPAFVSDPLTFPVQFRSLFGCVGLPDGRLLAYGTGFAEFGVCMQFVRLAPDGTPDYIYVAPGGGSAPRAEDALILAGVLRDLLRDANASPEQRVRTQFDAGVFAAAVDVGRDGSMYLGTTAWSVGTTFTRFTRSSPTELTIDPRPNIQYQFEPLAITRAIGEPVWLSGMGFGGLFPLTYQWLKDGVPVPGATSVTLRLEAPQVADAGAYTLQTTNAHGTVAAKPINLTIDTTVAPLVVTDPLVDRRLILGEHVQVWGTAATANPYPTFAWQFNGRPRTTGVGWGSGSNGAVSSLSFSPVRISDAGVYQVEIRSGTDTIAQSAIFGVTSANKVDGDATEVAEDIRHPNGNVYDQALLTGDAATLRADPTQVTRLSFIDLTDDIVQVEMSGAGTIALAMENAGPAATPALYNQPSVSYVKGHAGLVITGADETTHVTVFSVGRANAVNQALFRADADYHGIADLSYIAISSANGRFGGLRTGNVHFYARQGFTGIYAPKVQFDGPVYIGDIEAFDTAKPTLVLQSAQELRITGGDLFQANGARVQVGELVPLVFTNGSTSHGEIIPVEPNRGSFERDGKDVTESVVGR